MKKIQDKFDLKKTFDAFHYEKAKGFGLAQESLKFFNKSFNKQGWTDATLEKWQKRKKPKPKHPILVKTGNLKRSIAILKNVGYNIVIGTNLPYAKIHNEGFNGNESVRAHTRTRSIKATIKGGGLFINGKFSKGKGKRVKILGTTAQVKAHTRHMVMPQRQFMGHSQILGYLQINKISKSINSCFR